MPVEAAKVVAAIKGAKSDPIGFAFGAASMPGGHVLLADRSKNGNQLAALAKKEPGVRQSYGGTVLWDGSEAVFSCEQSVSGLDKLIETWARANKVSLKFSVANGKSKPNGESKDGEEDEDDPSSLFSLTQVERRLKQSKTKEMNFAFGVAGGKKPNLLAMHPLWDGQKLFLKAKSENGAAKKCWGKVALDGTLVTFTCEEGPIPGMKRLLKAMFKEWKLPFRIVIMGADGEFTEPGDEDDEGQEGPAPTERSEGPDTREIAALRQELGTLFPRLQTVVKQVPSLHDEVLGHYHRCETALKDNDAEGAEDALKRLRQLAEAKGGDRAKGGEQAEATLRTSIASFQELMTEFYGSREFKGTSSIIAKAVETAKGRNRALTDEHFQAVWDELNQVDLQFRLALGKAKTEAQVDEAKAEAAKTLTTLARTYQSGAGLDEILQGAAKAEQQERDLARFAEAAEKVAPYIRALFNSGSPDYGTLAKEFEALQKQAEKGQAERAIGALDGLITKLINATEEQKQKTAEWAERANKRIQDFEGFIARARQEITDKATLKALEPQFTALDGQIALARKLAADTNPEAVKGVMTILNGVAESLKALQPTGDHRAYLTTKDEIQKILDTKNLSKLYPNEHGNLQTAFTKAQEKPDPLDPAGELKRLQTVAAPARRLKETFDAFTAWQPDFKGRLGTSEQLFGQLEKKLSTALKQEQRGRVAAFFKGEGFKWDGEIAWQLKELKALAENPQADIKTADTKLAEVRKNLDEWAKFDLTSPKLLNELQADLEKGRALQAEEDKKAAALKEAKETFEKESKAFDTLANETEKLIKKAKGDLDEFNSLKDLVKSARKSAKSDDVEVALRELRSAARRMAGLKEEPGGFAVRTAKKIAALDGKWRKAVDLAGKRLEKLADAIEKTAAGSYTSEQLATVRRRLLDLGGDLHADSFSKALETLATDKDEANRKAARESALRAVRAYRTFLALPQVLNSDVNPFGANQPFGGVRKVLDSIELNALRGV